MDWQPFVYMKQIIAWHKCSTLSFISMRVPQIVATFGFVSEIDVEAHSTGLPQFGYTSMHIFP